MQSNVFHLRTFSLRGGPGGRGDEAVPSNYVESASLPRQLQVRTCLLGGFSRIVALVTLVIGFCMPSLAQEEPPSRAQSRSMVISRYGIVAAEHPFAAQAGANILAQGGNAVDAAIATVAVLSVVAYFALAFGFEHAFRE